MQNEEDKLVELANTRMPFGKYTGRYLVDLPETYVLWFKGKGYPEGKLGEQLRAIEEIKTNGLEPLLHPLIRR
jgi:uncharacterized protein